jgi:hypothetical protein
MKASPSPACRIVSFSSLLDKKANFLGDNQQDGNNDGRMHFENRILQIYQDNKHKFWSNFII